MHKVWDVNWHGSTKTLDVHMAALRRKLGRDPAGPVTITTLRGVGYRIERPEPPHLAPMVATVLTVLIVGVPLAYAVESRSRDDEIDRLQQLASAATVVVPADAHVDSSVRLPAAPPDVQLPSTTRRAGGSPAPAPTPPTRCHRGLTPRS